MNVFMASVEDVQTRESSGRDENNGSKDREETIDGGGRYSQLAHVSVCVCVCVCVCVHLVFQILEQGEYTLTDQEVSERRYCNSRAVESIVKCCLKISRNNFV